MQKIEICTGHELSPKNTATVLAQMPNATVLGGANQWAQRGRIIAKGSKALRIFAAHEREDGGKSFPRVAVFDISQTVEVEPDKREAWIARAVSKAANRSERPRREPHERTKNPREETKPTSIISERLLETARNRLKKAEAELSRPRVTNTHRRARIAAGMLLDAERAQGAARLIIAAAENPEILEGVTLAKFDDALNIARDESLQSEAIKAVIGGRSTARALIEARQEARGCGVDLFPTAEWLAKEMIRRANISAMSEVLEPSCGTGNLLRAIIDAGAEAIGLELSEKVAAVARLAAPSATVEVCDFMGWHGGDYFDAAVMNPPFSADQLHIKKAWSHLASGGRLVAICGASALQSKDKRGEFRAWLDSIGATVEPIDRDDAFEGTHAKAFLIAAVKD